MWFSLFALVLVLTILFFQALQGLFSAVITCVLTILSAALAFALYEDLYFAQLIQYQPAHGRAISLMAIFIVSLLALRFVFDLLVQGNLQFPVYVDRIGGGLLGFVTAMIIVGMLAIGIQMLPFGRTFLGFSRYALVDETEKTIEIGGDPAETGRSLANLDWSKVQHRRRSLWVNPDGFTASLMSQMSANALRGRTPLEEVYPDFLGDLYGPRARYDVGSRTVVGTDALAVEGYWDMPPGSFYTRQLIKADAAGNRVYALKPFQEPPPTGMKRVVVRVRISPEARDPDNCHRFTTDQFRLVGRERQGGAVREYGLVGINHEQSARWVRLYRGEPVVREPKDGTLRADLVFRVPDHPEFEPLFVEYKQNARAEIRAPVDEKGKKKGPPTPLPPEKPKEEKKPKEGQEPGAPTGQTTPGQDRVSGLGPARKESAYRNELPFVLTRYGQLEVVDGEVRGGETFVTLDDDWQPPEGDQPPAERFQVPADHRLLQLSVEKLQPQSWLGNIYGGVIDNIGDFYLIDEAGERHMPVGHWAMARVGGQPTFEVLYLDESQRGFGRLAKFKKIKLRDLQGDYALFYLFHLSPGCKPVKLHTGRTDVDLTGLSLVAPQ